MCGIQSRWTENLLKTHLTGSLRTKKVTSGIWEKIQKSMRMEKSLATEGSWEAGVDGAEAGIVMLADPQVGDTYRQEWYPGHAEDAAEVVSLNEEVTVPYGTFTNCLQTREFSTIDPELNEYKYDCIAVGAVTLEVVIDSGERVELIDVNAEKQMREDRMVAMVAMMAQTMLTSQATLM